VFRNCHSFTVRCRDFTNRNAKGCKAAMYPPLNPPVNTGGGLRSFPRVWQEILTIGAVAELARVQRSGDGLNSCEFSYRQELLPHPFAPWTEGSCLCVRGQGQGRGEFGYSNCNTHPAPRTRVLQENCRAATVRERCRKGAIVATRRAGSSVPRFGRRATSAAVPELGFSPSPRSACKRRVTSWARFAHIEDCAGEPE
jgi:hypothetical protein